MRVKIDIVNNRFQTEQMGNCDHTKEQFNPITGILHKWKRILGECDLCGQYVNDMKAGKGLL